MLCGIVFHFSNHRVALRQQLVEVFVDVVLSERAAQIFGANHSFSPGFSAGIFSPLIFVISFAALPRFLSRRRTSARGRVVPRRDFAPMRSNKAERTLRPLWVKSRHVRRKRSCPLYPQ